jgi:two-component system, cell cycle sensor histidine kinase and response regulator CckA
MVDRDFTLVGPGDSGGVRMNKRILVIDDSSVAIAYLRRILEADGHAVEALSHFVDLHRVMRAFDPEIVFLDIKMPALGGLKVGEFVRRFEVRRTQIVIYSSRPLATLESVAAKLDADAVVERGATAEHVRAVVLRLARASSVPEKVKRRVV